MSHVLQEALRFLGITRASAFVRAPEGNGCAERFLQILKEPLLWPTTLEPVEELRWALHECQRLDNETWLLGRHGYKTPAQVRYEQRCLLAHAALILGPKVSKKLLTDTRPTLRWVFQLLEGIHRVRVSVHGQMHDLIEGRNKVQINILRLFGQDVCHIYQISLG